MFMERKWNDLTKSTVYEIRITADVFTPAAILIYVDEGCHIMYLTFICKVIRQILIVRPAKSASGQTIKKKGLKQSKKHQISQNAYGEL